MEVVASLSGYLGIPHRRSTPGRPPLVRFRFDNFFHFSSGGQESGP